MKTLHLLRSKPTDLVRRLIKIISQSGKNKVTPLYTDKIDYHHLFKDICESDRIIPWW